MKIIEGVSIIVCCYNSAKRLTQTLRHLANQRIEKLRNVEIILVDNNSNDNTSQVATEIWNSLKNPFNLTIVKELLPGLSNARQHGVNVSNFEYLIFCDDDNWLDEDYIENIASYFNSGLDIDVIGGKGEAIFEGKKPFWFDQYYQSYAVGNQASKTGYTSVVYGAGLAIRKSILTNPQFNIIPKYLTGRKGDILSAGEDSEICYRVKLLGGKIFYADQLTFKHFLTANRLTWSYLKKLHTGFSHSFVPLHIYDLVLNDCELPKFYWLKKSFLYFGRTIKYTFLHFRNIIEDKEGDIKMIHIKSWIILGLEFLKYNTRIKKMYNDITTLKLND